MKVDIVFSMKVKLHILIVSPKVNLFKYFKCCLQLKKLATLQNQVKAVKLQDKLGKQNFNENIKKLYEPLTDTIKDVSENITRTLTENSNNNNKGIENLNEKILEFRMIVD